MSRVQYNFKSILLLSSIMQKKTRDFQRFISLSLALAKAEFKMRNEGSYLGVLWYLLNPILLFIVLLVVFSARFGNEIPSYPLYLIVGIVMYNFFQQTTTSAILNIDHGRHLIKSVKFPLESLVASGVIRNVFSHFFEIAVLVLFALFYGVSLIGFIYYIPLLFLFCIFIYGISLILAGFYVYFIDLEHIWGFFTRILFFVTPIFYNVESMTKTYYLNLLNPLFYFITAGREIIIYNRLPESWIIIVIFFGSFIFLFFGLIIFEKLKYKFAERL
jgi:ABC-2 type transport system permease protein